MSKRIVVDPITRIEGHLRIDVEVDGGKVTKSWSSGQMFRGIELILEGRDPREAWLFAQRICGVCTTVHAITSVRAVENAIGLEIPMNAQYIRNLILCAHALHDHIVHFYHLSALDWVDVTSALKADPAKASALAESLSPWPHNSTRELAAVKAKLEGLIASGQLGIFTNGYWGHPAMHLPPEVNLLAVSHYLQALDYQRKANKVVAILGSKTPNIQNLAVGGVANAINLDNDATLNMEKLYFIKDTLEEVKTFIDQVYLPDVIAIGSMYPEWLGYGAGVTNYMAVPDLPLDAKGTEFDLPGGVIMGGDLKSFRPIERFDDPLFQAKVEESVAHAWYEGDWQKHPWDEEMPKPEYTDFQDDGKYSWVKAPRFEGKAMQVGPLAQILMGYASGHELITKKVNESVALASSIAKVQIPLAALHSTLGRHLARAIRCAVLAELSLKHWGLLVGNIGKGDLTIWNKPEFPKGEVKGFGFHEAPRGTLSHWVVIRDGRIANYQAVVPSTWNAGPRDSQGQLGPYEASLVGNPIADSERPLEVVRTIHSFDPCLACAIHAFDPEGNETATVKVLGG
ncbi:MAG: nickel-dependent hydrogenase large subunit [Gemmatimonadales bacterium]|jgi:hydrogenase large subunit|nr:nickel-dependent hydrogenase large subunit [Gemmatimonadales bacterium]